MNWLPSFGVWQFAVAGVVAAAGTVLIHLLNRRRHQVLHWGAMEFLQRAAKRKRRSVQLRDTILLMLRTLAALFFGLALARPHFSADDTDTGPRPIHAIIVIDNTLSMSYATLDGSLLAKAKQAAVQIVERLPIGSNVSVLTSSGSLEFDSQVPTDDLPAAINAIERIKIADSTASINDILAKATAAADFETNQSNRTILLTDQQATTWQGYNATDAASKLQHLQIVNLAPSDRDNAWVADIEVQDGFAEARTRAKVRVVIRRSGGNVVRNAEVSLLVRDQIATTKSILLEAGDSSQVVTFEHSFITSATGRVAFVPIRAVLTPDRLHLDDARYAIVPVVSRLPIVFVDQFGADDEDVRRGRTGETLALRKLLRSDRDDDLREVTRGQRHIAFNDLDAEAIEAARLVIVAGTRSPQGKVSLLRDFVAGGGQLVVAAGGEFSASDWQKHAWFDGDGILPAPLTGDTIGTTPEETQGELAPKLLSLDSVGKGEQLRLPRVSGESLADLYAEALFFKAVEIDQSLMNARDCRVIARLDSATGSPLLIERNLGKGRVLFWTSGITSDWNTVAKSNAVVMLDRLVREAIRSTIADHNRTTRLQVLIELPVAARDSKIVLRQPNQPMSRELASHYIDREQFGVTIPNVFRRGLYKLSAMPTPEGQANQNTSSLWEMELAVNGNSSESDLTAANDASTAELAQHTSVTLTRSADEVSLANTNLLGQSIWWWFALVVLVLLFVEMLVLVTARRGRSVVQELRGAA